MHKYPTLSRTVVVGMLVWRWHTAPFKAGTAHGDVQVIALYGGFDGNAWL